MSLGLPQPTFQAPDMPTTQVTLTTTAPSGTNVSAAKVEALGRVPLDGKISIALGAAKTVTVRVFCPVAQLWLLAGSTSSSNQKVFAQNSVDTFTAAPNSLWHATVDATTATAWISGPDVNGVDR